uniref:GPS domain-containing protein n=1 Tax=Strongyloides stercoralis TaxID=6248 RepID=A0AAF5CRR6_STRER
MDVKSFLFYDNNDFLSLDMHQKIIFHVKINEKQVLTTSFYAPTKEQFNQMKRKFYDKMVVDNTIKVKVYMDLLIKLTEDKSLLTLNIFKPNEFKKSLSPPNKVIRKRIKRNTIMPENTMINGNLSGSGANTILVAYDVLLNKNQDIADVYLQNIDEIIKIFCNDTNIEDERKATGGLYTFIQTQILMANNNSIIYNNMTMAGSDRIMFSLNKDFYNLTYQYDCGINSNIMCEKICIGTSLIGIDGIDVNVYLRQRLFSTNNLLASYNNLVSDLRQVNIIDPLSGLLLNIPPYTIWSAQIPLNNYSSSNYYSCMLYIKSSWDSFNLCTTNDYAYLIENTTKSSINCTCSKNGIIGVFQIPPPKPQPYSIYQEILLLFKLSSPIKCDPIKLSKFFSSLSSFISISSKRFIKEQCSINKINDTISIILRPIMIDNDQSNAYIIQSIQRLINSPDGLKFDDKIKILSVYPNVINRNLTNDGNAKQVRITIDKKYEDVVFNNTLIINMWIKEIGNSLGVSQYRIKNPQIFKDIIFQFTITIPFEGEISLIGQILSAEELSQILLEQTTYGELILKDLHDEILPIKKMKESDIIDLIVLYQASTLLIILGSIVGGLLLITIFGILGLVIIKIRNDHLVTAARNDGVVTVNLNNMSRTTVTPSPQTVFVDQNSIV